MKVRKAVIPAAGFGTRFLPVTKSQPKEMLPIVDTPTIQYVVEEAVASGVEDILMVIGKSKRAIEEHFYANYELEKELEEKGKEEELKMIRHISDMANLHFIWQKELRGLGDAVLHAKMHVGSEPFALLLGDTLLSAAGGAPHVTHQLVEIYERTGDPVILLEQVPDDAVHRYGIAGGAEQEPGLFKLDRLVEKPPREEAPSNLAIASRYVLTADIFDYIEKTPPGKNGELQLTDALSAMLADRSIYGMKLDGKRYDIGNKLEFIKTNIIYGLQHEEVGPGLRDFIKQMADEI